ncbi:Dihydroneopterin aldolase 1 [Glycine soja]
MHSLLCGCCIVHLCIPQPYIDLNSLLLHLPKRAPPKQKMESEALIWGDKLTQRGLSFFGFHGALPEERNLGQKFLVDVDAWMDLKAAGKSDHLSDTVSCTDIYAIAKEILEGSPHILVESVAQKIAVTTLTNHNQISAVRVKVKKPHVAVRGPVDYLGVEIFRRRSDLSE